jgi:2-polyprenyl-3-methyl-5-hydroxy-6-metoxy-1,4-benzoquinol methylase
VSERFSSRHYSYQLYADPAVAASFDHRRFGGAIGTLVAETQAQVIRAFAGPVAGRTVLDVGTGTGRAALMLARAGASVTGIDASEQMLAVARTRAQDEGLPIDFTRRDAHDLGGADRAFDLAISLRVLMHTPDWKQCIAELCRVSSRLVIVDYPSARSVALVQSIARRGLALAGRPTEPYRVFSDRAIAAAFDTAGFRITSVHRQFVLPIALHKAVGSSGFTRRSEALLERLGALRLFGSPVTILAERCVPS